MTKIIAFLRRKQFTQRCFNLKRIFCLDKTEEVAYTNKVSIGNNGRLAEYVAANQICRFSADSRQRGQILNVVRNHASKIGKNFLRHTDNVLSLGAIKAA